ncbi:YigZ family protein [Borrelia miyamotoi]|uniref:YigZ family protein n=2 Tax=Borrelia miyamotoi TaxID=47466 RepID=A0AAP9CFR7_9SPIR|nr:YigZ family protein [Borrelia miyamotoi]ATQ14792.1 YigZ family protein [Borrelia miyamotoi]ATQ15977.1 YigZ family protein [Borrelia miyamotoi]ATQ17120.1 YigZ family protein [Borrelia miyamotoi]ATQ18373.1 YigZ family protein [Borrelia miyamotoi]ATQ20879.1 YigZ family protein [Borrelia miyamotoi]
MMLITKENTSSKIEVKKSIFLSYIFHVEKKEDINKILKEYKLKFKNATHVVYGFRIGNSNSFINGMSDDKEPRSTAGKPTLDAILNKNLTDTLIITIRYFGGTLLGKSGLIKAYSKAAQQVISASNLIEKEEMQTLILNLNYNQYHLLTRIKNKIGIKIIDANFLDKINTTIKFNITDKKSIITFLQENSLI